MKGSILLKDYINTLFEDGKKGKKVRIQDFFNTNNVSKTKNTTA